MSIGSVLPDALLFAYFAHGSIARFLLNHDPFLTGALLSREVAASAMCLATLLGSPAIPDSALQRVKPNLTKASLKRLRICSDLPT